MAAAAVLRIDGEAGVAGAPAVPAADQRASDAVSVDCEKEEPVVVRDPRAQRLGVVGRPRDRPGAPPEIEDGVDVLEAALAKLDLGGHGRGR